MNLTEWTSAFIDYVNSFRKDVKDKKVSGREIVCESKSKGTVRYLIAENLDQSIFDRLDDNCVLVTLNSKDSLEFLIENWNEFTKQHKLKIIFANPKINMQWSIMPHLHHRFSDPASLKKGLNSLAGAVPKI